MITTDIMFQYPIYAIGGIVILVLVGIFLFAKGRAMPYRAQVSLLTAAELKFYKILKIATPPHVQIMMKVRLADIITCSDLQWKAGWGPKISAKHLDFILIDPITTVIKLAIELDDSTHRTHQDRIDRDNFVNKAMTVAGVPLLRIPVQKYYDTQILQRTIQDGMDSITSQKHK